MGQRKIRKTKEQFVLEAMAVHGERYDYSLVEYRTTHTKIEVVCREHGSFFPTPLNHLQGSGCPACVKCKRTTLTDFIARSLKAHGNAYDYSKVEYKSVDDKVTIICKEHGAFQQIAYDHMKGRGCASCGARKAVNMRRHSLNQFIAESREFHGDKFDYSRSEYVNSLTPIEIICPDHGSFWQVPQDHKTRYGCAACSGLAAVTEDEFIRRAFNVHGETYCYQMVKFEAYRDPVEIICKTHGSFLQVPKDHIQSASGCPSCASERTASKEEREITNWLISIDENVTPNDRIALDGFEIDAFLPDRKIGIEYNGSYWHHDDRMVHPRLHETKALRAAKLGIRLVSVWDFDWKTKQDMVKRHILHMLGKNDGVRVDARKCSIASVDFDDAKAFYARTHIQGAPWRALSHCGLFHDDALVACMSFGQGNSRRGKTGDGEWELLRFSTDGVVRGAASRLFSKFVADNKPGAVWSFSDRQHFGGGLYTVLGFANDGNVPADYRVVHINKGRVWHKSAWKRKHIQARLIDLGLAETYDHETDPRTERDMQQLAGTIRIMDSGKIRWKWEQKNARTNRALADAA